MRLRKITLLLLLVCSTLPFHVWAEKSPAQLTVIVENDSPFKSDRFYTSGNFVSFTPENSRFNFTLGIEIYTPEDAQTIDVTDHPYAGWLYFRTQYNKLINQNLLSSIALSLGTTGRNSFAHDLQNIVHEILSRDQFKGWDSQIPGKFGYSLDLSLEQLIPILSRNADGLDIQTTITGLATVGNIKTAVAIRPEIKLGYNIDALSDKTSSNKQFRLYVFNNFEATYVKDNYLLEGNNGRFFGNESYDIHIKSKVYKWSTGLALGFRNAEIKVYKTKTTKRFGAQAMDDRYGGIDVSWKF